MKLPKFKLDELNNYYIIRKKDDKKEVLKWCIDKFIYTDLGNATLFGFYNVITLIERLKADNVEFVKLRVAVQEHEAKSKALSTH